MNRKGKKTKSITFATIVDRWKELEGKHLSEISNILGYQNKETCRLGLYKFRNQGKIDFTIEDSHYYNFKLTDKRTIQVLQTQEDTQELIRLRTWLAVSNAYRLTDLIDAKSLKPKEELEAIKELGRIERGLTSPAAVDFAKQIEEQLGVVNIWQEVEELDHEDKENR
ncbi:hypothetical protein [Streptococcus sp. sy018]|uniref:hypothetical protein n=1 Tax=Streptococcus sp. sy018 TaxID=2600147 RepID=UPI0011B7579F|nr:hypothetical protein [Streptococcus sp. sy018]TWS94560.1 hypothetical protein FRX52_03580 [Streptococcus sp. sy018]